MVAIRIPDALRLTDKWQYTCTKCGASRPFTGRIATRFSSKTTIGWCGECNALRFFNIDAIPEPDDT